MPLISIITPVYNVEPYLTRTIESVLAQSLKDFELILVDDCGTDNSIHICEKLAQKDSRIKVIKQSRNVGPMQTRQTGINVAEGDFFFFLDGDDTLPFNALEILYNAAIYNGSDIVRGQIDKIDKNGVRTPFGRDFLPYENNPRGVVRALLEGKLRHNLASALFSRRILKDYQYFVVKNMRNGEDGLLFYQMVQNLKTPITILQEVVYNYYMYDQSSSHRLLTDQALKGLVFFYDYVSDIPYQELHGVAMNYSTYNVNEFAIGQGYSRMKRIVKENSKYQYLSFSHCLKHLTLNQNLRFCVKRLINQIKEIKLK